MPRFLVLLLIVAHALCACASSSVARMPVVDLHQALVAVAGETGSEEGAAGGQGASWAIWAELENRIRRATTLKLEVRPELELSAATTSLESTEGRFLSLDPVAGVLSDPLSTQGWTYAHANPARFIDPDGRLAFIPFLIAAAKVLAVSTAVGTTVGAGVGAASAAYVADDASAETLAGGAASGAKSGAGFGFGFGVVAVFSPVAAAVAGIGGAAVTTTEGVAEQVVARNAEFRDEQLIREANATTAIGIGGFALGGLGLRAARTPEAAAFAQQNRTAAQQLFRRAFPEEPAPARRSVDDAAGGEFAADFIYFRDQPAAEQVRAASSVAADAASGVRPRPGAAGAIQFGDGTSIGGASVRTGGGPRPVYPGSVETSLNALEASGAPLGRAHGCCFEPSGLAHGEVFGVPTQGGLASARLVRSPTHPRHGAEIPACETCGPLLRERGVHDINAGLKPEPAVEWVSDPPQR